MTGWTWEYDGYDPAEERLRESLCTVGNGYLATRGALPECDADHVHYPGTYVAGCYDRLTSEVAGRRVENEDMVNLPNWLPLRFRLDGQDWLGPDSAEVIEHRQVLHLDSGLLERRTRYGFGEERVLFVRQQRLVHMADPHLAALCTEFTAEGFADELLVEAALDGGVTNSGVARYRDLDGRHLTDVRTGSAAADTVWLRCRTRTSDIGIGMAARLTADAPVSDPHEPWRAVQHMRLSLTPGRTVAVDKTVAVHTSRDPAIGDPLRAAVDRVGAAPGFEALTQAHRIAWEQLWRRAELDVPGEAGHILRLHLFHVLQTLSPHTADLDVGVPARGLHGEAYRGHVFWDELFVLPYLDLHFPEVSRALLRYRHRRLEQARAAARALGRRGALYPWQSGSDGREETQEVHVNPRSGRWLPDHSRLQRHVGSAVAYNVWRYSEASGDAEFLHTEGAETLLEIARFWADSATYDDRLGRHRIRGVVGPDEYHDAYPGATEPGLDDNAYTNVTAAWVLCRALDLLRVLPQPRRRELVERIGLEPGEPDRWEEVSRTLHVPFHGDGVISQFEGYDDLQELDWDGYRNRYDDIRRLDRILEAEGDTVNRYKASKQADVLMLGYLFSPAELDALFTRLGYRLDEETWRRTVDHYLRRTSHGSTLSGLVHGWVLARCRRSDAWIFVQEALRGDIADLQGGTTGEGIHLGAMGGTLDLVQRGLTGLETREKTLWLDPVPLPELSSYGFSFQYQGHWGVQLRLERGLLDVVVPQSDRRPIDIRLPERAVSVPPGETVRLVLPD
ncbi:glycoside hydrolase family 65 protein [Streptomyces brasiliensis]|uniref:glycoside hydrolase family 65 protein n=1 Tax=Streptomyces brasiliensis TaxID=1954 RepID=UPI001670C7A6|nr:glycoside hydrolase family 65 protein [Streptomyces brasiliensis]